MSLSNYIKKFLFKEGSGLRRIKFGIAAGMLMCINRRLNMREEVGLYEIGISGIFKAFARDARVSYDIGSCVGYYVLAMAKNAIEDIYAFDNDPEFLKALHQAVSSNGLDKKVHIIESRVGRPGDAGCSTLDGLLSAGKVMLPDFIKMDVDGGEVDILQGSRQVILKVYPSWIIEVHSVELEKECMDYLKSFGYKVKIVDNPLWLKIFFPERRFGFNRWIVATHEDKKGAR